MKMKNRWPFTKWYEKSISFEMIYKKSVNNCQKNCYYIWHKSKQMVNKSINKIEFMFKFKKSFIIYKKKVNHFSYQINKWNLI